MVCMIISRLERIGKKKKLILIIVTNRNNAYILIFKSLQRVLKNHFNG